MPAIAAAQTSSYYYSYDHFAVQLDPGNVLPTKVPYCSSVSLGSLICYSPNFLTSAYNFTGTAMDGTGQTILIVDAFGSPTIASDLAVFDAKFGIPAPPSFTILCGNGGCPAFNPLNPHDPVGWAVETSLDVEYAHAMAPGASIVLVVAATNSGNAINDAMATAIPLYPGSVISQSFGIPEIFLDRPGNVGQVMQANANYALANSLGITLLASAGDDGATNGFTTANALYPSSNPYNTAVGGTQGNPYQATGSKFSSTGANTSGLATFTGSCATSTRPGYPGCTPTGYGGERVWNEPLLGAATGGSPSLLFSLPGYQSGLGLSVRTTPDVSYNAAVNGGVLVYTSFLGPHWFIVGGTSASSPQWAAIVALVNQARAGMSKGPIGFLNPAVYGLSGAQKANAFHDITVGDNKLVGTPVGFSAVGGWDKATGWGTPNVGYLVKYLANS